MAARVEVLVELRREAGEGWGMNIGRRGGAGGALVITAVKPGAAASRSSPAPEIGDEVVGIGAVSGGAFTPLGASTTAGEMRDAFAAAGDACRVRLSRERAPAPKPSLLNRWGRAVKRRSASVDPRAALRTASESLSNVLRDVGERVASTVAPTEKDKGVGDVVEVADRVYVIVGGGAPSMDAVRTSLKAALALATGDATRDQFAEYGHGDSLDEDPLSRALFFNVGDAPLQDPLAGRAIDAAWDGCGDSPTCTLARVRRREDASLPFRLFSKGPRARGGDRFFNSYRRARRGSA